MDSLHHHVGLGQLTVIVPTRNELDNIPLLLGSLFTDADVAVHPDCFYRLPARIGTGAADACAGPTGATGPSRTRCKWHRMSDLR